jgi:hypothetical protein
MNKQFFVLELVTCLYPLIIFCLALLLTFKVTFFLHGRTVHLVIINSRLWLNLWTKSKCFLVLQSFPPSTGAQPPSYEMSEGKSYPHDVSMQAQREGRCIASTKGAPKGRLPGCSFLNPKNRNLKDKDFVAIMISKGLPDLPVSRNQPMKWADD